MVMIVSAVLLALSSLIMAIVGNELRVTRRRLQAFGLRVAEGPLIGHPLPGPCERLPGLSDSDDGSALIFVSAACEPCEAFLAAVLPKLSPVAAQGPAVSVIANGPPTAEMAAILDDVPNGIEVITGDAARNCAAAARVNLTPFGVRTKDRVVSAKGYLAPAEATDWLLS